MQDRYKTTVEIMKDTIKEATKNKKEEEKNTGTSNKNIKLNKDTVRQVKRVNNIRNPVSWWDEECRTVIEEKKIRLGRYQETLSLEDFIEYKKARAIARKIVKKRRKTLKDLQLV